LEASVQTLALSTAAAVAAVLFALGEPDDVLEPPAPPPGTAIAELSDAASLAPTLQGAPAADVTSGDEAEVEASAPASQRPACDAAEDAPGPPASWIRGTVTSEDRLGVPGVAITAVLGSYG
jgi:hypothetical protein